MANRIVDNRIDSMMKSKMIEMPITADFNFNFKCTVHRIALCCARLFPSLIHSSWPLFSHNFYPNFNEIAYVIPLDFQRLCRTKKSVDFGRPGDLYTHKCVFIVCIVCILSHFYFYIRKKKPL